MYVLNVFTQHEAKISQLRISKPRKPIYQYLILISACWIYSFQEETQ